MHIVLNTHNLLEEESSQGLNQEEVQSLNAEILDCSVLLVLQPLLVCRSLPCLALNAHDRRSFL